MHSKFIIAYPTWGDIFQGSKQSSKPKLVDLFSSFFHFFLSFFSGGKHLYWVSGEKPINTGRTQDTVPDLYFYPPRLWSTRCG